MDTPQPRKGSNRNLIIGIVLAVVLCCCCVVTAVGGTTAYQAYQAANAAQEVLEDLELPVDPSNPEQFDLPYPVLPGLDGANLPQGGLTDDVTRVSAWSTVVLTSALSGCDSPTPQGTTIEVVEDPDAAGVWKERWTVDCGDGTTPSYLLTFTPQDGFTNVEVAPAQ
jgi:hypothetical protein